MIKVIKVIKLIKVIKVIKVIKFPIQALICYGGREGGRKGRKDKGHIRAALSQLKKWASGVALDNMAIMAVLT